MTPHSSVRTRIGLFVGCISYVVSSCELQITQADTPQPRVILVHEAKDLNVGPGMNATGRDLRGCEFVGQDLRKAVFDHCDLGDCTLFDCDLTEASFRGTRLSGAAIEDCRIEEADFTDAVINGIKAAEGRSTYFWLSEKQLKSTESYKRKQLAECRISGDKPRYDFRYANLQSAIINVRDLSECDFEEARIEGITIQGGNFPFAELALTHDFKNRRCIRNAVLAAQFEGPCDFSGIDLSESKLFFTSRRGTYDFTDATITGCEIGTHFTKENLYSTRSYKSGNLLHVRFSRMNLLNWDFSGINLTNASFDRSTIGNVILDDAVITGVRFGRTDDRDLLIEQIKSSWDYKHGHIDGILPRGIAEALEREQRSKP